MLSTQNLGTYAGLPCSIAYSYQDSDARAGLERRLPHIALTSAA